MGILQDKGGVVELTLREGLSYYEASNNRQIASLSQSQWDASFTVVTIECRIKRWPST